MGKQPLKLYNGVQILAFVQSIQLHTIQSLMFFSVKTIIIV